MSNMYKGFCARQLIWAIFQSVVCAILPVMVSAQDASYSRQSPIYHMLERMEIKSGNLNNGLFLDIAPYGRANVANFLNWIDSSKVHITPADAFWLQYAQNDNLPHSGGNWNSSKKPVLKYFYEGKANLYQACTADSNFMIFINPVLGLSAGRETAGSGVLTRNTRGAEIRGMIDKRIGFYTYLTDNQVIFPSYVKDYTSRYGWIPGEGYWKPFRHGGTDFFDSYGYISFNATRHIRFQFGNDQNFIGSGFRSLLLSDFAKSYLNLKITTRIWRFQYQNIFAEFVNGQYPNIVPYEKKYGSFHYLSMDAAKWFNFGLFEGIMFFDERHNGRGYEFDYLNPVIFYRAAEQQLGSSDNALVGANVNVLPVKGVQLYGQLLLDEFRLNEVIKNNRGWWGNKYALQAGIKWIDIFGLPNVDLQAEYNFIRPYTYSADSNGKNYSQYSQSLAHPLGANLQEFIGILQVNSFGPLQFTLRYFNIRQGQDTIGGSNMGSNILLDYGTRFMDYGNTILQGVPTHIQLAEAVASYQLRHNLFFDLTAMNRIEKSIQVNKKTFYIGASIRLNFNYTNYYF